MPDDSRSDSRGDGPRRIKLEDLLLADEGPMRRDLLRQISSLEHRLSRFRAEHAPFDRLVGSPERGPALLTTQQLEGVRDELLAMIDRLEELVAERFTAMLGDGPSELGGAPDANDPLAGVVNPWAVEPRYRRLLSRLRQALRR